MTVAVLVRINCPDRACAGYLADTLIDERLAGCANISGPVSSVYYWQGHRHTADEYVIWLKTTARARARLCRRAADLHPDQAPAILALDCTSANQAWLSWLSQQTEP